MKVSHILLIILGALLFLMIGCFLFFGVCIGLSSVQDVYKDVQRLYAHRVLAGMIGFFFLCLGYVAVKILIKRSGKDEIFVVNSDYGKTSIAIVAVEDFIKKKLNRYDEIKKFKLRVAVRNKILQVSLDLVLFDHQATTTLVDDIQEALRQKLRAFIGFTDDDFTITIKVVKVVEKKETKKVKHDNQE